MGNDYGVNDGATEAVSVGSEFGRNDSFADGDTEGEVDGIIDGVVGGLIDGSLIGITIGVDEVKLMELLLVYCWNRQDDGNVEGVADDDVDCRLWIICWN